MPKRSKIRRLGEYGNRVLVFEEGHLTRVQFRDKNRVLRTKSWPKSHYNEALAFARGCERGAIEVEAPVASRVTLRGLWTAYSTAEFPHLRDRSQEKYAEEWVKWEIMYGRDFAV